MYNSGLNTGHENSGVVGSILVPVRFIWPNGGRRVSLSGSFTRWSEPMPMSPSEGCPAVFQIICRLPPGHHQYKFYVDGEWRHDENQPHVSGNYGVVNCVYIAVPQPDMVPNTISPETSGNMEVDDVVMRPEGFAQYSEADLQLSRDRISSFLSTHTVYELLPDSGKVTALDVNLAVKQAFHVLYEQGLPTVPLWDDFKGRFVGVLSALDFILILRELGTNGSNLTEEELETHTISAWKVGKLQLNLKRQMDGNGRPYPRPLVQAGPYDSLKEVALKILQNKVATVPIIHSTGPAGSCQEILYLASLSDILKCICRHFKHSSSSLPILQQPVSSIQLGTWVPIDKERLTAEMAFKEDSSAVIKIRQRLPDFLQSVKLKYVKLGYGYSCNFATIIMFVLIVPLSIATVIQLSGLKLDRILELLSKEKLQLNMIIDAASDQLAVSTMLFFLFGLYWSKRSSPVYLVDFSCYKPADERKMSMEAFLKMSEESSFFQEESLQFQKRIASRASVGDETYLSRGITSKPPNICIHEARVEADEVMFGALDSLFEKTGVEPSDVGILIVNCSLFNPVPSLSSMIVNHYKLRDDIKTYNLGGMGCSAGLISIELAKNLLKANPNSYAVVVSTENITQNWYSGNDRSMLLCNCLFRMGGAAVLLSNKARDRSRSKYELVHLVRTHKGADDKHFNCVRQAEDDQGIVGVSLSRDLMAVAGDALKTNITTLGPLVLPWIEQFRFFVTLVRRKMFKAKVKPYIPDFKLAFEHFCIHSGGRAVLDEIQKNLQLRDWHMEPSRMTLHRFGNTSSSSLWYELAYTQGKGRVARGDRVWQIAFGSGFKCNSAVWRALMDIPVGDWRGNAWVDSIDKYPVKLNVA